MGLVALEEEEERSELACSSILPCEAFPHAVLQQEGPHQMRLLYSELPSLQNHVENMIFISYLVSSIRLNKPRQWLKNNTDLFSRGSGD
jgi:hypothetical protein